LLIGKGDSVMRLKAAALLLALLMTAPVLAQQPLREVNITQGSEAGWIPSEDLEERALATWRQFNALVEAGEYDAAYAMMGEGFRAEQSLAEFRSDRAQARTQRGPLIARDLIKITWTKDSPAVPYPGTYLAIDASARFTEVDRFCGYTILYLSPGAQDFTVMRLQEASIDNASYAQIASQNSDLQALLVWRALARSCPNYTPEPLPENLSEDIEYSSVAEARAAVAARERIETWMENGWTIMADKTSYSVWSFAPEGAPSYPAVIKRWVEPTGENTSRMSMAIRCGGEKPVCDALFDEMAMKNGFTPVTLEQ
jgi:Protein of unknown function (DUF4019)